MGGGGHNSWGNSSVGPALAAVGDHVYAAWKGEQDDERLFYSVFDGANWTAQQTIPGNSSVGPALAHFRGHPFAIWKGEFFDQRLYFSSFDGNGWAPQQTIAGVASAVGPSVVQFGSLVRCGVARHGWRPGPLLGDL